MRPLALLSLYLCALAGAAAVDDGTSSKRISEQKCEEYLEQISKQLTYVPLTAFGQPVSIKVSDCDADNVPLIVGGKEASLGEFPHMAALGYRDGSGDSQLEWMCGGSLISERYVLTAAHCINSDRLRVVRLGEHDLSTDEDGAYPLDFPVEDVILHPDYRPNMKYHDIALIKLSSDVRFSQKIRPACLRSKVPNAGVNLTATGWGRIQYSDDQSPKLLKVTLPVVSQQQCTELWASTVQASKSSLPRGIDYDVMLCAGDTEGGKDTCYGDSGGPLGQRSETKTCVSYVVGVTSFGRSCGWKNSPGIYTRVAHYLPWIESVVWPQHQQRPQEQPQIGTGWEWLSANNKKQGGSN